MPHTTGSVSQGCRWGPGTPGAHTAPVRWHFLTLLVQKSQPGPRGAKQTPPNPVFSTLISSASKPPGPSDYKIAPQTLRRPQPSGNSQRDSTGSGAPAAFLRAGRAMPPPPPLRAGKAPSRHRRPDRQPQPERSVRSGSAEPPRPATAALRPPPEKRGRAGASPERGSPLPPYGPQGPARREGAGTRGSRRSALPPPGWPGRRRRSRRSRRPARAAAARAPCPR